MNLTAISTERCELKTFNDSQNLLGWTLIPVSESDLLDFGLFISRKKMMSQLTLSDSLLFLHDDT